MPKYFWVLKILISREATTSRSIEQSQLWSNRKTSLSLSGYLWVMTVNQIFGVPPNYLRCTKLLTKTDRGYNFDSLFLTTSAGLFGFSSLLVRKKPLNIKNAGTQNSCNVSIATNIILRSVNVQNPAWVITTLTIAKARIKSNSAKRLETFCMVKIRLPKFESN